MEQPQPQPQPQQGTLLSFMFCGDTFVDPQASLYDRVLIGKHHFVREFINRMDDHETNDDKRVFLLRMTNPETTQSIVVNVEGPHRETDTNAIFAPQWVLEALTIHEIGQVLWERVADPPPRATKIYLRPIDTLIHEIDGRAEIEEHLKHFNVIQEGVEIQIPLRPFDNYLATVYVEKLEPASTVLLRDEVELELLGSAVEPPPQPEPQPSAPQWQQPEPEPTAPIVEEQSQPQQQQQQQQQPDLQTRRKHMAEAAERRRLAAAAAAAEQANTANTSSN
jgi:hypothetical protein